MTVTDLIREVKIARQDAEVLLASVLGVERAWIYAHGDALVPPDLAQRFRQGGEALRAGEPLAYVLGYRDFWTLRLRVNNDVLIPRRETEHLVEWASERIAAGAQRVLDLGTGSGAVALACKSDHPEAEVCAVDLSPDALACARANGQSLGLSVDWREGDWFCAVKGERWQLILSNPPYIAADDPHLDAGDLPAEPTSAISTVAKRRRYCDAARCRQTRPRRGWNLAHSDRTTAKARTNRPLRPHRIVPR